MPLVKGFAAALSLTAAMTAAPRPARAVPLPTYLALGDSMAFGETDFTQNPSNGDRGYVNLFADNLGTQAGGARPITTNLGVDGETSTTFLQRGTGGNGQTPGTPGYVLNTNYASTPASQNALMEQTIQNAAASGHPVQNITLQLGANDLLQVVNTPGFMSLTPDQQQAKIAAAIGTVQANLSYIMGELHGEAPQAKVYLLGYHDPYAADPNSAMEKLAGPALQALNGVIDGVATATGAKFVDTALAIKGHEFQDTYIATGNVHPNQIGYAAIAAQLDAASTVPEPSSFLVLGAGVLGGLALRGRLARRRTA